MIVKEITYLNFDGVEVTKEARFHAYKSVLLEITSRIEKLTNIEDMDVAFPILKNILVETYGELRGDLFVQSDEVKDKLRYTNMLDELVFNLLSDPQELVDFMVGMMPNEVTKALNDGTGGVTLESLYALVDDMDKEAGDIDETNVDGQESGTIRREHESNNQS